MHIERKLSTEMRKVRESFGENKNDTPGLVDNDCETIMGDISIEKARREKVF